MKKSEIENVMFEIKKLITPEFLKAYKQSDNRNLHLSAISMVIPFFYTDKDNYIHNYKFKEYTLSYLNSNDEINNSSISKNSGVDSSLTFSAECKSMTIKPNDKKKGLYKISPNLIIGEVDKIQAKANNLHEIYSDNTKCDLVCGCFAEGCADPIIVFKIKNNEWGPIIQSKITNEYNKRIEKFGENAFKNKRDSILITVGDFIQTKSFKIIYIGTHYSNFIFSGIDNQSNLKKSFDNFS